MTISCTPRQFYDALIASMPAGIDRALLRVLSYHVGKDNAISKRDLAAEIQKMGIGKGYSYSTLERLIRDAIADMDNDEVNDLLIISSTGDGGYFIPATMEEYQEFYNVETSRARELEKRIRATKIKAERMFQSSADAVQVSLF